MSDEELIARLREVWAHEITIRAADRIEALTKERDQHWDSFVYWRKEADDRSEQLAALAKLGAGDGLVERRMDAYYYGFTETGIDAVDKILSAVACAGKAYHHTSQWGDECPSWDDHTGKSPIDWIENAAREAADRIAALTEQNQTWQRNSRETFDAMVAMRNSINEHLPMPSLESDLLQGPENSVFCAAVADAVVQHVAALTAERDEAECEKDRLAEINRNLCNSHNILLVDGSNWQARAEAAEAERDALRERVARLDGALKFYADESTYEAQYERLPCGCCADIYDPINNDKGAIARAALTSEGQRIEDAVMVELEGGE